MTKTVNAGELQKAVAEAGLDGWLLYDFRGTNPLARSVLGLDQLPTGSRRWFYLILPHSAPIKIVHGIETEALDSLPGERKIYRSYTDLKNALAESLKPLKKVAMEYAPLAGNPYISRIDAGTIELIRACGPEVVSSGDLIQKFAATLSEEQFETHLAADAVTRTGFEKSWEFIEQQIRSTGQVSEQEVCKLILDHFEASGMTTYSPPIVARQPNNRFPHYETGHGQDTMIRAGDLVLIDMWCKAKTPHAIYSDISKMAYVGQDIPSAYSEAFALVIQARDTGLNLIQERCQAGEVLAGWEVDRAVRKVIADAGKQQYFLHRTGHSLGEEVHSNGAHLDDYEMHEERTLLPSTLMTIEPGLYQETFGLRSEINVFINQNNQVQVTGGPIQNEIQRISI